MNKGKITCSNITHPSMMEECGNKKYNDKNENEIDASLDIMNKGK